MVHRLIVHLSAVTKFSAKVVVTTYAAVYLSGAAMANTLAVGQVKMSATGVRCGVAVSAMKVLAVNTLVNTSLYGALAPIFLSVSIAGPKGRWAVVLAATPCLV